MDWNKKLIVDMGLLDKFKFWRSEKNSQEQKDVRDNRKASRSNQVNNPRDPSGMNEVPTENRGQCEFNQEQALRNNHPSTPNNRDNYNKEQLKQELQELRSFTMDNMDSVADEFEEIRKEVEDVREQSSEVHDKMFYTMKKAVNQMDEMEEEMNKLENRAFERIEKIEKEVEKSTEVDKKLESLENKVKSEIKRLEKQKVDGKELAQIQASQSSNQQEDNKKRETEQKNQVERSQDFSNLNLTKKERAKIKILELLKQGKGKTEIRNTIEGDICSREWFYKAWTELEKEEAYISGRGEALIHPEDYKSQLAKQN